MSDLTAFLLARIAEDEAAAKVASVGSESWTTSPSKYVSGGYVHADQPNGPQVCSAATTTADNAAHIARHDPARVLRECEAKRRIVGQHPEMLEWCQGCAHQLFPCLTIRGLASVYADHPDYREEWKP